MTGCLWIPPGSWLELVETDSGYFLQQRQRKFMRRIRGQTDLMGSQELCWDESAGAETKQLQPRRPTAQPPLAQSCLWGRMSYRPSQGHEPAPGCTTLLVGDGSGPLGSGLKREAAEGSRDPELFCLVNTESRILPKRREV